MYQAVYQPCTILGYTLNMLALFVRHTKTCLGDPAKGKPGLLDKGLSAEALRTWRKCGCPKWYTGTYEGRWHPRTSLGTTDWAEAERRLTAIQTGKPMVQEQAAPSGGVLVKAALEAWLEELALPDANIAKSTLLKRQRFAQHLAEFCQSQGVLTIQQFTAPVINRWRASWQKEEHNNGTGLKPSTARLRLARLSLIFKFARRMGWLSQNPMEMVKQAGPSRGPSNRTMPLDEEGDKNYRALLKKIPEYLERHKNVSCILGSKPASLVAITEVMYETGLRVSDAIQLKVDEIEVDQEGWGTLTMPQQKGLRHNAQVTIAIPPDLTKRLLALPKISGPYVFYDGRSDLRDFCIGNVYRYLRAAGEAAGIVGMRPHRLRDSFAVNRLNEGMLLQDVSKLLGHASVTMTERYYSPWVKSRRDALVARRKAAHGTTPTTNVVPIKKRRVG